MNPFVPVILLCSIVSSCNSGDNNNARTNSQHFPGRRSSVIIYLSNNNQVELTNCEVEKTNDSIAFNITDSSSLYQLKIRKVKDRFNVHLEQTFSITDSSYKKPTFTVIDKSFKLDKPSYEIGDDSKGFLKLKVAVLHQWIKFNTDTISVAGLVYATVH